MRFYAHGLPWPRVAVPRSSASQARVLSALAVATVLLSVPAARAQTIYPIDRAEILAGATFDLKVELPGAPPAAAIKVTIDGRDAAELTGKNAEIVVREDGLGHTAYWLRGVSLATPGAKVVAAEVSTASGAAAVARAQVTWDVYATPVRKARNVILLIGDGMSVAHRTAARILSKGIREGRYGGDLAMDDMPAMALVSTAGSDSIITDSANSASAYTTGHKTCVGALGVYCARNKGALAHPRVETITSLVQRRHAMAVGVVTNAEIVDATPAAMVAHTLLRRDRDDIVRMFFEAAPDVVLGGGSANFLPRGRPDSLRRDDIDYLEAFKAKGYAFAATASELAAKAADSGTVRLLGLFNTGNIDGALDLKVQRKGSTARFPDQPDLVEQTKAALAILARKPNGFVLMVESARIDKYSHSLDWERAVFDTIMLDKAVEAAKDFARDRDDTLIIVVPDHAHPVSLVGTFDDARPGQLPRDKLATYGDAGFPAYPAPDAKGYPPSVDVQRRLAMMFGAYPDHCFAGKPSPDGEFQPAVPSTLRSSAVTNERNCRPGTVRLFGNLPLDQLAGVHAGDDVVLTAMGPGSELLRGRIDNTRVFRVMATALGLAAP